jgi:hypothetical protein
MFQLRERPLDETSVPVVPPVIKAAGDAAALVQLPPEAVAQGRGKICVLETVQEDLVIPLRLEIIRREEVSMPPMRTGKGGRFAPRWSR